jgi:uncharacterized protein YbaP (TraB family)
MMWKVTSDTGTAYLLGSIHIADKNIYPLPQVIEDAFAASKTLVVEINLKKVDQQKLTGKMMSEGLYPEGDALSQHIPKATADALTSFCERHPQIPRVAFERFRPWLATVMIGLVPFMEKGEDPASGVDMHFLNEASTGQNIQELETADFQLKLLSSFTDQEQVEELDAALKAGEHEAEKVEAAYFAGDDTRIIKLLEEDNGPKSATQKLIYARNPKMADGVESCIKTSGACFVVVGAAHLVGEHGVVRLLQERHYHIEPVVARAAQ